AGGSMLYQRSTSSTYHYNSILNSYNSGLISANSNAGGIVGYDNPSVYNGITNARTNLYYDTSILVTYDQPFSGKPAVINHTYGKTSDFLLYGDLTVELKFDPS